VVLKKDGDNQSSCLKTEEVLQSAKGERNILHTVKWRKINCIGHILCRSYLLKHSIEGKVEETGRWGRRWKLQWDDLKEIWS